MGFLGDIVGTVGGIAGKIFNPRNIIGDITGSKAADEQEQYDAQRASNQALDKQYADEMSKNLTDLRGQANAIQGPNSLTYEGGYSASPYKNGETAYAAKDYSGALPEFDYARQRANEQANNSNAQTEDAMARRFASQGGGLNSGSFIKQTQIQEQQNQENKANTNRDISFQEAQARRALQQGEENKVFQSSEATKGRTFQGEQAAEGRTFAGQQAAAGRNFTREQFNAQIPFETAKFKFDANSKINQMDMATKEAEMDRRTTQFNEDLQRYTQKHSGGLLGSGGILGTGLGS